MKKLLFICCMCCLALAGQAALKITRLTCEMRVDPVGIGVKHPRLGWQLVSDRRNVHQKAYQIWVASTPEKLERGEADIWNPGRVESDRSIQVVYAGQPLKSNHRYYWKVKVWTDQGEVAESQPARWITGLFSENDWKSQWIGMDRPAPWDVETKLSRLSARYLRKEFACPKQIRQATVHISGLGLYELYLNGQKVGDQVLAPVPTDYRKSVMYNSFDVTPYLQQGDNAVGVVLGNGRFYTMRQNFKPYKIPTFGYPKLRMCLIVEYTDGSRETIGSNNSWKMTADGPIRTNNEYDGEEYDARKELTGWAETGYNDSAWQPAERVSLPDGVLTAQPCANMKVMEQLKPRSVTPLGDSVWILDMGQNIAGWVRIWVKGDAGDTIRLRFAETLQPDGSLFMANLRDAQVTDRYILKGAPEGEEWAPRFVYHGFRYVEVKGCNVAPQPDNFIGEVVYDDLPTTGSLTTSSGVLNQIIRNAYWGIRDNYKGMPVDCPQRNERQPWLGDRVVGSLGESYLFGNASLYGKWMDDIREAQRADGCIPDVAPAYWNYYSDNMTWPSAFLLGCDMLYRQFGDVQPMERNYEAIKRWLQHMQEEYLKEGIMTKDKYGDWCVPPESLELIHSRDPKRNTDGKLIATAYYYNALSLMEKFARLTGHEEDIPGFAAEAERTKEAFNRHFFRTDSLFYDNNTVTANILPLAFGMVPREHIDAVSKNVIRTIIEKNKGQISTGVIGSQWLMRTLTDMGRGDVAYVLATNTKYPGWGYMVAQGATTIWELWNGNTAISWMNSGNHVMLLGDLLIWCFEDLAGIRSDDEQVAFHRMVMKPDFDIQELSRIDASYETPYGRVVSRWNKTLSQLEWHISVPANTTASICLPSADKRAIREGGRDIAKVKEVRYQGKSGNSSCWEIGSGDYVFTVDLDVAYGKWRQGIVADEFLYEKASFPECHAATIAETPQGLVAAFFGGTKERNPDCCIWVCRRTEKGWTAPLQVADGIINDTLRKACWNPVLFQIPGGDLLLFYKIGKNVADWTGHLLRSKDGGLTWSEPEALPEGFIGPVKNKPFLIGKKMICPSSTEGNGWKIHFEITEDWGKTWRMVGPVEAKEEMPTQYELPEGQTPDPKNRRPILVIQPSIIQHPDGRLQVLGRTRNGQLATSWSNDQGESWSTVELTDMPNNNSGTDAMALADGRCALVYNHVRTPRGAKKGLRTPLCVALSRDGVEWYASLVLEDSPVSQYSYPSMIQGSDGMLHFIYTWRRQRIKYIQADPRKMKMVKIEDGRWPGPIVK